MRLGAENYVTKPFDRRELFVVVRETLRAGSGRTAPPGGPAGAQGPHIVESEGMRKVLELAGKAAASDATLLITGETGTGKELVANAIHHQSRRRDEALVKLNSAALAEGVVESELFGHERGAFTGALERRLGRFELADGGTLFLDEIGELSPRTQAKLLRVIQSGEFERVGGQETIRVNTRVLCATNRLQPRM